MAEHGVVHVLGVLDGVDYHLYREVLVLQEGVITPINKCQKKENKPKINKVLENLTTFRIRKQIVGTFHV